MKTLETPYELTLTQVEREAIDWIGHRYTHGDELYQALCKAQWSPADADWGSATPITFQMPEHVAWQVREAIEGDDCTCLDEPMAAKLWRFSDSII